MVEGRSGVAPISRFDASDWPVRIAAEVDGFDGPALLGRRDCKRMDRFTQFAMVAADEAVADAGIEVPLVDPTRLGVYVGSGIGGLEELVQNAEGRLERGWRAHSPFFIPKVLTNLATGLMAIRYGAQGPSLCVTTACATANHMLGEAMRAIAWGDAEVIIAGGSEAPIVPVGVGGFMVMKALSKRNDDPTTASRPFDAERDGFVIGEGAGIVVLEELEHARARGARIYCELAGYALNNDAFHMTAPGNRGASRCMDRALRDARVAPEQVDYINAHGTSTPANDVNETTCIREVFGGAADDLVVSSTKSVTGHLLGAAGGVEALASAMALHTGVVPPTATLQNPDPACDLDYVPGTARELSPDVALSNSFGFGGTNATLVFRRFQEA